jgi:hypothetical protein
MEELDRLKIYVSMAENTRKWVSVMDTKAGFLSALNAAALTYIWTGAKLGNTDGCAYCLTLLATALISLSLFLALNVVLPRVNLKHAFGKPLEYVNNYEPVSYFGYVATNYPPQKHAEFILKVDGMDERALAREALEQHYTTCHVVQKKSMRIAYAGWLWMFSALFTVMAMMIRG